MAIRWCWVCGFAWMFVGSASAQIASPAEVFPARTLVYGELCRPAELAKQLRAGISGTLLDDTAKRAGSSREGDAHLFAGLRTLFGPKQLHELGRCRGIGFGLTQIDRGGRPTFLVALLPGESRSPGRWVSAGRKLETVGGATIFRVPLPADGSSIGGVVVPSEPHRGPFAPPLEEPERDRALPDSTNSVFAVAEREYVLVSDHLATLKAALARATGRDKSASFAQATAFTAGASLRTQPGVLLTADLPEFFRQADAYLRANREAEPFAYALARELLPPTHTPALLAHVGCADGTLRLTASLLSTPTGGGPLVELVAGAQLDGRQARGEASAGDAWLTLALTGRHRAARLLAVAEAVARATGELGIGPAEAIEQLDAKFKLDLRGDVLANIAAVELRWPSGGRLPALRLHLTRPAAAEHLEHCLPGIIGWANGAFAEPIAEKIAGQTVRTLPGAHGLPFARRGTLVSIARRRADVALGADTPTVGAPAPRVEAALGVWHWGKPLQALRPRIVPPATKEGSPNSEAITARIPNDDEDDIDSRSREATRRIVEQWQRLWHEIVPKLEHVPPLRASVQAHPDRFTLTLTQPGLEATRPMLIERGLELWLLWGVFSQRPERVFDDLQ